MCGYEDKRNIHWRRRGKALGGNLLTDYDIHNPKQREILYKRTLLIIVISQIFGGAGLAAGITVGALLAEDMLGTNAFAGVPVALFTLGSAGAALMIGRLSNRYGRRIGLSMGFIAGGIGAIGVVLAALSNSIFVLFFSLLIYGAGTATNLQARYAGTDLATDKQRARAISIAMVSTTFGAVAGPNLVDVMGSFAKSIGVPELAGPFILAAAAYLFAGFILFLFLRPDPYLVALAINAKRESAGRVPSVSELTNKRGITAGSIVMIISHVVMVAIMTMTPVYMGSHGHSLRAIGLVIGIHIGAMYLPSLFTGVLVDKVGRPVMAIASAVTLLISGIIAAVAPGESLFLITLALALLGLGWNFGLISGTAILVDATNPRTRAKTQGTADVFIALAGSAAGILSGVVVAGTSFGALSIGSGILVLLFIPVLQWSRKVVEVAK